jgi:hypothetical protein
MTATRRPTRPRSPWASDEHELFRETARAWIEREILPHDARWQARGYVDPELWQSAGEAGLLGTDVPAEHGGLGGDFGFECVIYEELLHAGFACFGKGVHEIATHYVGASQDRLDGLTVDLGDWWFNLRPSNTEPLLRLNLEAVDRAACDAHTDEVLALIRAES